MNLNAIFEPRSIAVVGASTKEGSVGNDVVKNLVTQGYEGKIYPVNPKAEELYGLRCYPNLKSIGERIDLVVVVVPAAVVPGVMEEAAELKVKGAIIISAGFKEAGHPELEEQIKAICLKNDIALIGPNCLGVVNPEIKMNASFAPIMPQTGNIGFLSQSGALGTAVLDYAQKLNMGFSKFVSVGNKALVDEIALFEYLYDDPQTKVIALYAEQLTNSENLIKLARKITTGGKAKPIIALKSGRTAAGASASASHTGALIGNDTAYDALFRQAGIIRVHTTVELFEYLRVFSNNPLPKGNRVAIVTNAGGPGVLTTDECISHGLALAPISVKTEVALKSNLPASANWHNPIDILGDAPAERYQHTLQILANDPDVDSLIVILTPQSVTDEQGVADAIINTKKNTKKPMVVSFVGGKRIGEQHILTFYYQVYLGIKSNW